MPAQLVHRPSPVNQFYKLDQDTPTGPWVKVERWNHTHNGVNFDGALCMASAGAVCLDAHTGGRVHASPGQIHDHQDDRSGGIGVDDVEVSWDRGWGETLYRPDWFNWADTINAVKVQHRVAIVGFDHSRLPLEDQVQKGGDFDHAMNILEHRGSDSRILRADSLDTKLVFARQTGYRAAAEALALRVRGTRERLFVAFSRTLPVIDATVTYRVGLGMYTPLFSAPGGARVAAARRVSYVCSRTSVDGQWWYRILTRLDGTKAANARLYFRPNAGTTVRSNG